MEVLVCVDCWLPVSYPRLPTPGGRIFGSFTTILFEPGTRARHRSAQYSCPKGKWQTMPLPSAFPASCSPDFPSTGPRDLWPGPGGSTSGLWTRWGKAPGVQGSEQCLWTWRPPSGLCSQVLLFFFQSRKSNFLAQAPRGAAYELLTEKSRRLRCSFFGEGEGAQQARAG